MELNDQVTLFREYLKRCQHFEKTVLAVIEQGDDAASIETHRTILETLDDIIHQFDEIVKINVENNK
jgi:hypothetical protein